MKKLLLVSLIAVLGTSPILAEARGYGHGHGGGGGWWLLPALVGGAILYDVTRPRYVEPQTVYVQPAPVYYSQPVVYGQPTYYSPPQYVQSYAPPAAAPAPAPAPQVAAAPVWYFCASSDSYYPYAQACPEGWKTVAATPPAR